MLVKIRIDPKAHCICWTGSKTEAVYPSLAIMVVSMLAESIIGDDWQVEFQRAGG